MMELTGFSSGVVAHGNFIYLISNRIPYHCPAKHLSTHKFKPQEQDLLSFYSEKYGCKGDYIQIKILDKNA